MRRGRQLGPVAALQPTEGKWQGNACPGCKSGMPDTPRRSKTPRNPAPCACRAPGTPLLHREVNRVFYLCNCGFLSIWKGNRSEGLVIPRGRKASVRYYASKDGYFTHFEGKNIRFADGPGDAPKGKTYLMALARFQELMQVDNADPAARGNTVRVVVDLYRQRLERNGQDRSLEIVLQTCTSTVAEFGDKTFQELKPVHVTGWLVKMAKPRDTKKHKAAKWGSTYQNIALRTLVAAFNWALALESKGESQKDEPKKDVPRGVVGRDEGGSGYGPLGRAGDRVGCLSGHQLAGTLHPRSPIPHPSM